MEEQTQYNPGQKAPNDGHYMEVGENAFHVVINDPKIVELKKGDAFPETSNDNRKWVRVVH